jgi:hypothetical protein
MRKAGGAVVRSGVEGTEVIAAKKEIGQEKSGPLAISSVPHTNQLKKARSADGKYKGAGGTLITTN